MFKHPTRATMPSPCARGNDAPSPDTVASHARSPYRLAVSDPSPATFVLGVALAAAISAGVFWHANRHGSTHATAWGVAAFLFAGIAVPVYFLRFWISRRRGE